MSQLLKVFMSGMESISIMPNEPTAGSRSFDPRDYIHESASEAIEADWRTVGTHLLVAADKTKLLSGEEKR